MENTTTVTVKTTTIEITVANMAAATFEKLLVVIEGHVSERMGSRIAQALAGSEYEGLPYQVTGEPVHGVAEIEVPAVTGFTVL